MQDRVTRILFFALVFLTSFLLAVRTVFKVAFSESKTIIFINYRAFGHSVLDSYGVYDFYGKTCLIVSIGERFERNTTLNWIIPPGSLFQFYLPSWHRRFSATSKYSLRKFVGPAVFRFLRVAQTLRLIPSKTQIEVENAKIMLELAPFHLKKYISWDFKRSKVYVKKRIEMHTYNEIAKSNGVGTQIYASIVDRIPDDMLKIPLEKEIAFRHSLESMTNTYSADGQKIFILIISARGKPHHGRGLQRYLPIIRNILKSPKNVLILLGDYAEEIASARSTENLHPRLLIPEDFTLTTQEVQFLSIRTASLVFGDPSGVWSLFLLLGTKGILIDHIPTGELLNRCLHLPRIWVNEDLVKAPLSFQLKECLFRLRSFVRLENVWSTRLHSSEELCAFFSSTNLSSGLFTKKSLIGMVDDTLNQYLLQQKICALTFE